MNDKNYHLIILYEDRKKWIKRIEKEYPSIETEIINILSNFLVSLKDIFDLYDGLKDKNKNITVELLEITDFKSVSKKISNTDTDKLILWNITDGRKKYKGSYIPAYASLLGIKFFGNNEFSQMMAQDKYKMTILCDKLKINIPKSALYRNDNILNIEEIKDSKFLFVKGNSLDNNISIYNHSKCTSFEEAQILSKQLSHEFKDDILIQEYITGYDLRVQYINIDNRSLADSISIYKVTKSDLEGERIEFITEENRNTHNERYDYIKDNINYTHIKKEVNLIVEKLMSYFDLKDYFAIDLRVYKNKVYFIELNTAPFLTYKRYKSYFQDVYKLSYYDGIYKSVNNSFNH